MFEQNIFPDFIKKTGTKITYVAGQPADTIAKMRAQKANPAIDVAWLAGGITFQAIDEGLLTDIDKSSVPNLSLVNPDAGSEKDAAPFGLTVCAITSNTDRFAKLGAPTPTSWFDMWDPKFKGHVGCYSINVTSSIAFLSKIAQVLSGNYRNLDAAFAKFKELRPNMLDFYPSAGAYETAMQQGDCWIGMNTSVRGMQMANAGMPILTTIPKEGTVAYQTWLGIVKSCPHPNAAHAFMDYMLSTDVQQKMISLIGYSPVNREAKIPDNLRAYFPDPANVLIPDWRSLSKEIPAIVDRWNRDVER
jgi:putative spermidine/putrescine transport system substrate-binding protein